MKPLTIRERLYDYIRVADDKKIKAIYNLLETDITKTVEWWLDKVVVPDLDNRYKKWQAGKEKGYTLEELQRQLLSLKLKRDLKKSSPVLIFIAQFIYRLAILISFGYFTV